MLASDFERLIGWLLYPSIPLLYGLALLIALREERLVELVFVGFQADPAGTRP